MSDNKIFGLPVSYPSSPLFLHPRFVAIVADSLDDAMASARDLSVARHLCLLAASRWPSPTPNWHGEWLKMEARASSALAAMASAIRGLPGV